MPNLPVAGFLGNPLFLQLCSQLPSNAPNVLLDVASRILEVLSNSLATSTGHKMNNDGRFHGSKPAPNVVNKLEGLPWAIGIKFGIYQFHLASGHDSMLISSLQLCQAKAKRERSLPGGSSTESSRT